MSVKRILLSLSLFFLTCFSTFSQDVELKAGFVEDSVGIGIPIHYWMVARYPADLEVVMPDSLYIFNPYDLLELRYQPTVLEGDVAFDSVVYTL